MKKLSVIISTFALFSCGMSDAEKEEIAIITCNIMGESRNMDGALRIKEINAAREKIGGKKFLETDEYIKGAMIIGLCEALVLDDPNFFSKFNIRYCARFPEHEICESPNSIKLKPETGAPMAKEVMPASKKIQEIRESVKNRVRDNK